MIAHARRRGRVYRGGGNNFAAMQNATTRLLKQESGDAVFFTTLLDLYALAPNFPGFEAAEQFRHVPYARVKALEKAWSAEVHARRFIPFIELHEFEALLFSDVNQFAAFFDNAASQIAALQKIVAGVQSPELIDDRQYTAPSSRICAQFPEYQRAKQRVGPQMAERIGLGNIRSQCPHFKGWLERLEQLGSHREPERTKTSVVMQMFVDTTDQDSLIARWAIGEAAGLGSFATGGNKQHLPQGLAAWARASVATPRGISPPP